jgi:hypothetical protein
MLVVMRGRETSLQPPLSLISDTAKAVQSPFSRVVITPLLSEIFEKLKKDRGEFTREYPTKVIVGFCPFSRYFIFLVDPPVIECMISSKIITPCYAITSVYVDMKIYILFSK